MTNEKIRVALLTNKVPQWKLAKALKVSETTVARMLREERPESEQDELVEVIKRIVEEDR